MMRLNQVGTLKIVPKDEILKAFRADYEKMRSMFAGEVIEFDVIMEELSLLESKINGYKKSIVN
ncbi:MAG: hypothetical protein NTW78_02120 [Campylobacterales bacterium]|nr:hypothetical protein [Campylobacterales bacterium]